MHGCDVFDVDERAPHPTTAVQRKLAPQHRIFDERVDDEIEAHPRAVTVDGSLPKDDRREAIVRRCKNDLFGESLREQVRSAGCHRRRFVAYQRRPLELVRRDFAIVNRSTRREREASDAVSDATRDKPLGPRCVHLLVRCGVILGRRVVGESGEMTHCIDAE